jgi:hypothetical protein
VATGVFAAAAAICVLVAGLTARAYREHSET